MSMLATDLRSTHTFIGGVIAMALSCKAAAGLVSRGEWDMAAFDRWLDAVISNDVEFLKSERAKMPMIAKLKTERELNTIRGKMLVAAASPRELQDFLTYVTALESLVEEANLADFYGTEGWRRRIGLED